MKLRELATVAFQNRSTSARSLVDHQKSHSVKMSQQVLYARERRICRHHILSINPDCHQLLVDGLVLEEPEKETASVFLLLNRSMRHGYPPRRFPSGIPLNPLSERLEFPHGAIAV